jgi:hypothetical protein
MRPTKRDEEPSAKQSRDRDSCCGKQEGGGHVTTAP